MFPLCQPNDEGVCIQCEQPLSATYQNCIKWKQSTIRKPSIIRRVMSRCGALSRWKKAGKPTRTKQRVHEIFTICESCELFAGDHCAFCGCPLNEIVNKPKRNKIALATEECPIGKWKAEVQ